MRRVAPDPRLDLEPLPHSVRIWLFALAVLLPAALAGIALWQVLAPSVPIAPVGDARFGAMAAVGACGLVAAAWWCIDRLLRRHRLIVEDHGLEVTTTFHRRSLALGELDLDAARVVDLGERTELRPGLMKNGTRLPGLRSGWFRLRNGRKGFVAMTSGPRVLWIPTRNGYDLLLQPRQPQALLDRLRSLAATTQRR